MPPQLEHAMADRIKATTVTLPTGHAVMLAKPGDVAAVILRAADAIRAK